jgi:hypothetical protein
LVSNVCSKGGGGRTAVGQGQQQGLGS